MSGPPPDTGDRPLDEGRDPPVEEGRDPPVEEGRNPPVADGGQPGPMAPPPDPRPPEDMPPPLLPVTVLTVGLCFFGTLSHYIFGILWAGWIAAAAFPVLLLARREVLNTPVKVYSVLVVVLAIVLAATDRTPWPVLFEALERAAFFAALFAAVGFLAEPARTSRLVNRLGLALVRQPPGRRYLALTLGAHGFTVLLTFGSIALLGTMIQRTNSLAAAAGDATVQAIREKRMLLAQLRGFSVVILWAPTTISMAVVLATVGDIRWATVAPMGFTLAMVLLALGWLYDRLFMPRRNLPGQETDARQMLRDAAGLLGITLLVILSAGAIARLADVGLVVGVVAAVPIIAIAWILGQSAGGGRAKDGGPPRIVAAALTGYARGGLPRQGREIAIVGASAAAGLMIASALPPSWVASALAWAGLPAPLLLSAIVVLIVTIGQIGINPMVSVTVLGTALTEPGVATALDPSVLAVALLCGWAITLQCSPFTASVLMTARFSTTDPPTLGRRWNGPFTLVTLVAAGCLVAVFQMLAG